ncbi:MAG TPA: hypothetical protein VLQ45_03130 [Thermoanaerobaculia bacterium]|nr:hypothetical protein [Thermoanaerobaculia bacterium]
MAGKKKDWVVNVAAYTVAGGVASALVGWGLALLGRALLPEGLGRVAVALAFAVTATAAARELGWLSLPLPQWRRQTRDVWAKRFRGPVTAAFWGFDVGLLFTTWFTLSGVWCLIAVALLARDPAYAVSLLLVYWAGRALSVWLTPLMLADAASTPQLLDAIGERRRFIQRVHALALAGALGVLAALLVQGRGLGV